MASAVRINQVVIALDELKVGQIPGSARSVMRGTFTFCFQDAYGVQVQLPACDSDVAGSFTCALVGSRPSDAQLRRFLGALRSTVGALLAFQQDGNNELAGEHSLARMAQVSAENLATYNEDGSIPKAILDALVPVSDLTNSVANIRSTHAHGNREPEGHVSDDELDLTVNGSARANGAPYVIETNAVKPSGSDLSVSGNCRPGRLRGVGARLQEPSSNTPGERTATTAADCTSTLAQRAATEAAAAASRPPLAGTRNALVIPHTGRLVSDYTQEGTWVAAYRVSSWALLPFQHCCYCFVFFWSI